MVESRCIKKWVCEARWRGSKPTPRPSWRFTSTWSRTTPVYQLHTVTTIRGRWTFVEYAEKIGAFICVRSTRILWRVRYEKDLSLANSGYTIRGEERGRGVKTGKENGSGSRESFYPRSGSDFYCARCFRVEGIHFKVKSVLCSFVGTGMFSLRSKQQGAVKFRGIIFLKFPAKFGLIFLFFRKRSLFRFSFSLFFISLPLPTIVYTRFLLLRQLIVSFSPIFYRVRFLKWWYRRI